MSHPQMIVFNTDRPVLCEAILPADTQRAAPARVICRDQTDPGDVVEYCQAIAGHGRAALHVEQRRVPRPTELGREETDGVGLACGRKRRIEQADARVLDVGPIALRFQSEHKLVGLPAIPDLSADKATGAIRGNRLRLFLRASRNPRNRGFGPIRRWRQCRNRSSHRSERPPAAAPWCRGVPPYQPPTRGPPCSLPARPRHLTKSSSLFSLHPRFTRTMPVLFWMSGVPART